MCMDFRNLNAITIKDKYPVPHINDLLDKLRGAKYFTRLDIISAYNMIRIAPGDEWKTAFRTPDGCFEWLVMPFGLANSPPTWQTFIDQIFRNITDGIVSYVDDFLVYAQTKDQLHAKTVEVLQKLKENNLYCKLSKCVFEVREVDFLGFLIKNGGIKISPKRIATVTDWPIPKTLQQLQQFLGFTNFYRRFISQYAKRSASMTNLLKKEATKKVFTFNEAALESFNDIKNCFSSSPMLRQWDPNLQGILETDASGGGLSAILSQIENNLKKPVAFWSRKLKPEEVRYGTPDQELLAVVDALDHFRIYLEGAQHKIKIYSDHTNLKYFKSTLRPNRRQAGYIEKLAAYDFDIYHFPGKKNPADAPSRRPDYMTKDADNTQDWGLNLSTHENNITINAVVALEFRENMSAALKSDKFASDILKSPLHEKWHEEDDALWYEKNRLYMPESLRIRAKELSHDSPLAGHWGTARTIELAQRNYYWPNMAEDLRDYVASCQLCLRNKHKTHKPYGKLSPLPIPEGRWSRVAMDFITDLPKTKKGNTAILTCIDAATRRGRFMVCKLAGLTAEKTANLFRQNVIRQHGIPKLIITDRGRQFINKFWKHLSSALGFDQSPTITAHQRGNGLAERINQPIEAYLRAYVNFEQNDWDEYLDMFEFCWNNSKHAATGMAPFYADQGYLPNFQIKEEEVGEQITSQSAAMHVSKLNDIMQKLKSIMEATNNAMARHYDTRHKHIEFQVGDWVMLKTDHIKTIRSCKKLTENFIGPFKITERVTNQTYRLDLKNLVGKIHDI
ncbi:Transposon Tf2-9 polyprotein, partial [Podosphaera aphanis]